MGTCHCIKPRRQDYAGQKLAVAEDQAAQWVVETSPAISNDEMTLAAVSQNL